MLVRHYHCKKCGAMVVKHKIPGHVKRCGNRRFSLFEQVL